LQDTHKQTSNAMLGATIPCHLMTEKLQAPLDLKPGLQQQDWRIPGIFEGG
jgi:hypothetical protein